MGAKVHEAEFYQAAAAVVLAQVFDQAGNWAVSATAVKYTVISQHYGVTASGDLTPTWHNPPLGTSTNPDPRWENRVYQEEKAGFNFEAVIPGTAFAERDFYRVEIECQLTGGYVAPIILEGPAISRQDQSGA